MPIKRLFRSVLIRNEKSADPGRSLMRGNPNLTHLLPIHIIRSEPKSIVAIDE